MGAGTAVNNCATAGKDTASSLNAARAAAAAAEMGCTCYWGRAGWPSPIPNAALILPGDKFRRDK